MVGAVAVMGISYYATGSAFPSVGQVWSGLFGSTSLYRTISVDDYAQLIETGKLNAGSETFVTRSIEYAKGYEGVTTISS